MTREGAKGYSEREKRLAAERDEAKAKARELMERLKAAQKEKK